jgi:hypothetical protein
VLSAYVYQLAIAVVEALDFKRLPRSAQDVPRSQCCRRGNGGDQRKAYGERPQIKITHTFAHAMSLPSPFIFLDHGLGHPHLPLY